MAERSAIFCDGPNCTRIKGEANHWTKVAKLQGGGVAIADTEAALAWIAGARSTLNPDTRDSWTSLALDILDACSAECEQKLVAKIRAEGASK